MNFEFYLILESIPKMLAGLGMTMQLLFISSFFGLSLAILLLLMRISGRSYLSFPAFMYIYFFRGTPILVQIFVIYHGFPQFEFIRESMFWPIIREPYGCAIMALSLNSAAYVSEILRGGYLGVDRGLHEAGMALGLSKYHRFFFVTTPIAIRLALPAYSNDFISMVKATSLASTITLLETTGVARTIVAQTYAPYEIFISAAIIYLVIAWFFQRAFGLFERYMSRYTKQ
ncbi:MAG: ABC transporter permease subunit [Deltaproteobacteria bacterium]|nr:ABC transporter permease subunit [Deltaproteobacteria bacterium]